MKKFMMMILVGCPALCRASAYSWEYAYVMNGIIGGHEELCEYGLYGEVMDGYRTVANATGPMIAYWAGDEMYMRQLDRTSMPIPEDNVKWILTYCGELLTVDSFAPERMLPFVEWEDYSAVGGVLIEDPGDFYLAFELSENNPDTGTPIVGWMRVSVSEDRRMTLLDSAAGLDAGLVYVGGAIPEPSSGLLLLLGFGLLGLRRRF